MVFLCSQFSCLAWDCNQIYYPSVSDSFFPHFCQIFVSFLSMKRLYTYTWETVAWGTQWGWDFPSPIKTPSTLHHSIWMGQFSKISLLGTGWANSAHFSLWASSPDTSLPAHHTYILLPAPKRERGGSLLPGNMPVQETINTFYI